MFTFKVLVGSIIDQSDRPKTGNGQTVNTVVVANLTDAARQIAEENPFRMIQINQTNGSKTMEQMKLIKP